MSVDPPASATVPTVPHHGGTPVEMLRDLADFLDTIDRFFDVTHIKGGKHDGMTFGEVLRGANENGQQMQADVRWLADWLEHSVNGNQEGR